jgi:RNA polymerase sporulation-specific sigma factor
MNSRDTIEQAQNGDQEALRTIIEENKGLVYRMVGRYWQRCVSLDREDLFQEGVLGLMRAVRGFDPARGYSFSTYATTVIRSTMQRAIDTQDSMIRLPIRQAEALRQGRAERAPQHQAPLSFSYRIVQCDDDAPELGQRIAAPDDAFAALHDALEIEERVGQVAACLRQLPARQQHALAEQFGLAGADASHMAPSTRRHHAKKALEALRAACGVTQT